MEIQPTPHPQLKQDWFQMAAQFTVYKKQEEELDEYTSGVKTGAKKKKGKSPPIALTSNIAPPPKEEEPSFFPKKEPKKGQDKFVPLFSKEGREAEVRHLETQASVNESLQSGSKAGRQTSMRVSSCKTRTCLQLPWVWKGGVHSRGLWALSLLCHPGVHQGGAGSPGQEE